MFGGLRTKTTPTLKLTDRLEAFTYLSDKDIYLDAACQSLRPQPVIEALTEHYRTYNACGGRVKYAWGQQVDEALEDTRAVVLKLLSVSAKDYATSFTLNTTYGINLLLQQLPAGRFTRVVTSDIEHNSVFLPTITLAERLGIERLVLDRSLAGELQYTPKQLDQAVVVVNAMSNIDGRRLGNLKQLVADTHKRGGIVIVDAAQAMAHNHQLLVGCGADAICFSAHKMYSASLGVIVARRQLLASLEPVFVGGGMVKAVRENGFDLLSTDPATRLEPGLQAFGEIIAFRQALRWLEAVKPSGQSRHDYIDTLSQELFAGLQAITGLKVFNHAASPVISVYSPKVDAHQLAIYLSAADIMVRSGYFCCHYYLREKLDLPPLLRFSVGLHNTRNDITTTLSVMRNIVENT